MILKSNKRILSILIELMNDPVIVDILIELHCLEIIVNQIEQTRLISIHNEDNNEYTDQAQEIKIGYWD